MLTISQLKEVVGRNPILAAALSEGAVSVIYQDAPRISDDRLYGMWTIQVQVLDEDVRDLVVSALRRTGWTLYEERTRVVAEYTFPITPAEREAMQRLEQQEREAAQAVEEASRRQQVNSSLEDLTAQLTELREDMELSHLVKVKDGRDGAPGPMGPPGRDGRDLDATTVDLEDLANVDDMPALSGQVLTWDGVQWTPRHVTSTRSMGGGGVLPSVIDGGDFEAVCDNCDIFQVDVDAGALGEATEACDLGSTTGTAAETYEMGALS